MFRLSILSLILCLSACSQKNNPAATPDCTWSILKQRCYPVHARADIKIQQGERFIYALLSEDKQQAEVFTDAYRGLMFAVKGGYRSSDGTYMLQFDGQTWRWRSR